MKTRFLAALFTVGLALLPFQAKADLVYDNGGINGTITAYTINYGWIVSNSFAVATPVNLVSANVGLWVYPGETPVSVDWSIGTSAFGSEISSGTSTFTNTSVGTAWNYYSLFDSEFAINGAVGNGTYYLTLQNAVSSGGNPVYWDQNFGPSVAFQSSTGQIGSESFSIHGESRNSVPDSSATLGLFAGALAGLALVRRRRS